MSSNIPYLVAAYVIIIGALVGYHLWVRAKSRRMEGERDALRSRLTDESPEGGRPS